MIALVAVVILVFPLMMAVLADGSARNGLPYAVELNAALDDLVEFASV